MMSSLEPMAEIKVATAAAATAAGVTLKKQVTFVECASQDKVSTTQWRIYKERASPELFVGRPQTVPTQQPRPPITQHPGGPPLLGPRAATLVTAAAASRLTSRTSLPSRAGAQGSLLTSRASKQDVLDLQREAFQLFERERSRLMEKPGAAAGHRYAQQHLQEAAAAWGERGGGGEAQQQHTQYIRRLADLRDELLSQEQTALARALDRLRLHSLSNKDAASRYRLKIKDQPLSEGSGAVGDPTTTAAISPPGASFPRPLVTTLEKFRQMRPERHPPVLFPLQGKQLIEAPAQNASGSNTRNSVEEGPGAGGGGSSRVEETVKANLQRLIQPTSSIPNIGRKALRQAGQEVPELKPQALHHARAGRVFKSKPRPRLASPFMLHQDEDQPGGGAGADAEGDMHMSPLAYKLGPMTDGDRLDADKLRQYYYICCLPTTPNVSADQQEFSPVAAAAERRGQQGSGPSPAVVGVVHQGAQKPAQGRRRNHHQRDRTFFAHPYSGRSNLTGSLTLSSESDVDGVSTSLSGHRPRGDHHRQSNHDAAERVTLPMIHADRTRQGHQKHYGLVSQHKTAAGNTVVTEEDPRDAELQIRERRRRHIVVDMPHIIFNAATPDLSKEPSGLGLEPGKAHQLVSSSSNSQQMPRGASLPAVDSDAAVPAQTKPGMLSKMLKQNEIRHRELRNLLEDVKELNQRTDSLSSQAVDKDVSPAMTAVGAPAAGASSSQEVS